MIKFLAFIALFNIIKTLYSICFIYFKLKKKGFPPVVFIKSLYCVLDEDESIFSNPYQSDTENYKVFKKTFEAIQKVNFHDEQGKKIMKELLK